MANIFNTMKDVSQFCRDNDEIIAAITDLFDVKKISPETGEQVLLFMAGMSRGIRGLPLTDEAPMQCLAVGWQIGAKEGA